MRLVRNTDQAQTMMDLQMRRGDRIFFSPQRLPIHTAIMDPIPEKS